MARAMGALLIALLAAQTAAPPAPTIAADRPGVSYAAAVVPAGRWQTELGVRGIFADTDAFELPVLSARLGVGYGFELQVGLPSYTLSEGPDGGLSNLALGFKFGGELSDWLAASFVWLVVAPTGDPAENDATWSGLGAVNVELYFLEDGWVSANAQLDGALVGHEDMAITPSLALGWTLFDAVNPFVQGALRVSDGETEPLVGGGIAWLVTSRVQLDVSADYLVDSETVLVDGGVSVLW